MIDPLSLDAVNALAANEFIAQFGDIAEHSKWVAEKAELARPYPDQAAMVLAFQKAVLEADREHQLQLILAHPDLAGRATLADQMADASKREQRSAGLDTLNKEEFEQFHNLNNAYRSRFGFPFIFAVTGANKHQILESFSTRVGGTMEEERLTAIAQILRIIRFRLTARVSL
jgi:2-oxo-4-hydroxy-4-carboxy-5-ureidoimidazoline decarboxylase